MSPSAPIEDRPPLVALIVEDIESDMRACVRVLNQLKITAHQASTQAEAIAQFEGHLSEIRLLLVDLNLPNELAGIDFIETIASRYPQQCKSISVIFTSGVNSPDNRATNLAHKFNFVDFLDKANLAPKILRKFLSSRKLIDRQGSEFDINLDLINELARASSIISELESGLPNTEDVLKQALGLLRHHLEQAKSQGQALPGNFADSIRYLNNLQQKFLAKQNLTLEEMALASDLLSLKAVVETVLNQPVDALETLVEEILWNIRFRLDSFQTDRNLDLLLHFLTSTASVFNGSVPRAAGPEEKRFEAIGKCLGAAQHELAEPQQNTSDRLIFILRIERSLLRLLSEYKWAGRNLFQSALEDQLFRTRRRRLPPLSKAFSFFLDWFCGYGNSLLRLFRTVVGATVIFAVIYFFLPKTQFRGLPDSTNPFEDLVNSFYISFTNLTRINTDFKPDHPVVRGLFLCQALCGYIIFGLFIGVLRKKLRPN